MKLRAVRYQQEDMAAVWDGKRWVPLKALPGWTNRSLMSILALDPASRAEIEEKLDDPSVVNSDFTPELDLSSRLPFEPRAYRDFMLYEQHVINAKRGALRLSDPALLKQIDDHAQGKISDSFKPTPLWYRQPIYYFGNHLNFYPDGAVIPWPTYTQALDYELELGIVIAKQGRDLSEREALDHVGGFVIFNDWSARDVQSEEMASGFGPQKAKNFANSLGNIVVTADEMLPLLDTGLKGRVYVNGELRSESSTAEAQHSIARTVSFASLGETIYPGELMGSGTLPGSCGLEIGRFLSPGDTVRLELENLGELINQVGKPE